MAPGMEKQQVAHNRQYGPPAPGVSDSAYVPIWAA